MKLGTFLADCARRHPEREAVVCGDRRVSFAALHEQSSRLANALVARGQKLGDRVALYLPNGAELVEAMAAVAKSGGVIVPISTRLAPAEVAFIFEDCTPRFILFTPEFRAAAHAAAAALGDPLRIVVGPAEPGEIAFEALIAEGDAVAPPTLPAAIDDLVIGYTSGTTGRPKGAIGTHRNIIMIHGYMNGIEWRLGADDRVLVTTPMAHRTGLGRVGNALVLGTTIVILPQFDAKAAVDLIEKERVTIIGVVPTIARLLMPEIERRPASCRSVRTMLATGEVFPNDLKRRLFAALPDIRLFSFFAQTESGFVCCLRPEEQMTYGDALGRPVPGVEIRFVDAELRDVPAGEPGEMLVRCGGPGEMMLTKGYWRRPEATAELFVDGWLRTGDVARIDADGYVYFVDRAKDMIVSGGLNIYSKEVELALIDHPAVADAAVVGVPDATFGESVCAYVELAPGATVDAAALIEHCRARIASYKKPKHVRFVDRLPRTSSGKVIKKDLREAARAELAPAAAP
ncbi:MAG: AMP-binding protein [Alphaproteobacteria bacterium]|nr:AMP-binding protein [Alphaproteobacteria bacterium]